MRMSLPATSLLLATLGTASVQAQGFEGTITWAMGKNGKPMVQTYKGSQVRMDMSGDRGGSGAMIMNGETGDMTMIMAERKMYMTMNMKGMAEKMEMEHKTERKPPKITDTGKTETIAGKTCEVYRYAKEEGQPETMEMCVAKGMGYFMGGARGPMGGGRGGEGSMAAEIASNPEYQKLYKDGFFPLRVSRIDGGTVKNEMLATKIDQSAVPASAFEVPAGYTEMKMPAGMGMPQERP